METQNKQPWVPATPPWQTTATATSTWASWQEASQKPQPPRPPGSPRWRYRSPRNRREEPRDKGKGEKGKGDKGKSSGKGKSAGQVPVPPAPAGPVAPTIRAIPVPKAEGAGGSTAVVDTTNDRKLLDALVSLHAAKETELPENIKTLMSQYNAMTSKQEAQQLHHLVEARAQAKKEINKITTDRARYETSWAQYIDQLGKTLQDQLKEREKYLSGLTEALEAWTAKASAASTAIAQAAGDAPEPEADQDEDFDEEMIKDPVDTAWAASEGERVTKVGHGLLQLLQTANSNAAPRPDHSRSPRRRGPDEQMLENIAKIAKKDMQEGQGAMAQGVAPTVAGRGSASASAAPTTALPPPH